MPRAADLLNYQSDSPMSYFRNIGQSIARGVPQLATGFVDLASLPFTATGLIRPDQAVGSTDYLTAKGLLPPKQTGFVNESAELLSGAINPAVGLMALGATATRGLTKAATKAGQKVAKTEFELAHEAAQRNAALPIEQGGLGLPANNTAMDRAKAMGYDIPTYHGTTNPNIEAFDPSMSKGARQRTGIWSSENPELANTYAGNMGGSVYPLLVKSKGLAEVDAGGKNWSRIAPDTMIKHSDGTETPVKDIITSLYAETSNTNDIARFARQQLNTGVRFKDISDVGAMSRWAGDVPETATNVTVFKPENVRSRFAAFDPMKKNSANILAGTAAGGVGLSALYGNNEEFEAMPTEAAPTEDVFSILYK
jgi:hypothetical protein